MAWLKPPSVLFAFTDSSITESVSTSSTVSDTSSPGTASPDWLSAPEAATPSADSAATELVASSSDASARLGVMDVARTMAIKTESIRCQSDVFSRFFSGFPRETSPVPTRASSRAPSRAKLGPNLIGTSLPGLSAMDECSDFASLERPACPRFCLQAIAARSMRAITIERTLSCTTANPLISVYGSW